MRKVKFGERELELRATPLALLFYRQTFDRDLIGDITKLQSFKAMAKGDMTKFDSILLLQIAYAMHRAADFKKNTDTFEQWLDNLGAIDFGDPKWLGDIVEEAIDGFFRTSEPISQGKTKRK